MSYNNGDGNYTNDPPAVVWADMLTVEAGGHVNSDSLGYNGTTTNGTGPGGGQGGSSGYVRGGGGGNGGHGGFGTVNGGSGYGSVYTPTDLGSGGGGAYAGNNGATGGTGGGALHLIITGTLTVNGTIHANGSAGGIASIGGVPYGAGGGSGGSVWIEAGTLVVSGGGQIQANGGASGGGGGAGGRIALYYNPGTSTISGSIQARGGATSGGQYGTQHGGPGTIYWDPTGTLTVDNGGNNGAAAELISGQYNFVNAVLTNHGHLSVLGSTSAITLTGSNLTGDSTVSTLAIYGRIHVPSTFSVQGVTLDIGNTLTGDSTLTIGGASGAVGGLILRASTPQHVFGSLTIAATGQLTLVPLNDGDTNYAYDAPYQLHATNLTVNPGGWISSSGYGYAGTSTNGYGPGGGQGANSCYARGAGGGYGGRGGDGRNGSDTYCPIVTYVGGPQYGSISQPTDLGSAGGAGHAASTNYPGASGGGAIRMIITGTLTVNGDITANGSNGSGAAIGCCGEANVGFGGGGGGSGGSIWIKTGTLAGAGRIRANGGSGYSDATWGYYFGSGGGGGRIAFDVQNFAYTGSVLVAGGRGYQNGQRGTISGLPMWWRSMLSSTGLGTAQDCDCGAKPHAVKTHVRPINSLTGGLEYATTDLSFPALGGELAFVRSYASLATELYTNTLGYGWTHNLDTRLISPTQPGGVPGQVLFKAHSANQYLFFINDDGTYAPYPGVSAELTRTVNGTYELVLFNQEKYTFDAQGKITTWTDNAGHTWTYTYDGQQRLYRVTSGSRYLQIGYNGTGQIETVSDHTGRSVSYSYTNGDLTSVVDVLGQSWTYEYDGATHRLTEVIDPTGRTLERTEYDPTTGRALRQYNGNDELIAELTYNGDGTTTVEDGLGNVITDTYTARNTIGSQLDALGGTLSQSVDANFQLDATTDQLGNTTRYTWTEDGANMTAMTNALSLTTRLSYDGLNNPTRITDTLGYVSAYTYTGSLLTRSTDALNKSTIYTYTSAGDSPQPPGLLKAVSDPLGQTTTYAYNEFGQVVTTTDPSGLVTVFGYDNLGRVVTTTTAAGTAAERVTVNAYNAAGLVLTTTRNYLAGQPQNYQDLYNQVTGYQYDLARRLVRTTDALGRSDWTCYDDDGRVVRTVQNATGDGGTPQTNPCDAANYVPSTDPAYDRINQTVYDANGNVIATIDPAGKVTRTYYNELQRPTIVLDNWVGGLITDTTAPDYDAQYPDQNVRTTTVYDAAGNVVQSIDNANLVTHFCYDALNRVVKAIQNPTMGDPCVEYTPSTAADADLIQQTVYDEGGNVIATIDPAGRITRTYYDALNRPDVVIQNLVGQAITVTTPPSYDNDYPDRNVGSQTFYDDAGRAYRQLDLTTNRSDWTCFDNAGRLVRTVQNASGGTPCAGGYTPSGAADEDVITEFVYDAAGRQIATIAPDGQITRTYFDPDGRRTAEVVNLVGQAITVTTPPTFSALYPDQNITTRFGYDVLGRVVTTTLYADSPQQRTNWTCYDALGRNIRSVTNASGDGSTPQTDPCDADNYQFSSAPDYDLVTTTVYDLAGQAIGQVDASGTVARTYFDGLYRPVVTVQNLTGQAITVTTPPGYNPALPDANVRRETRYDDAGRVYEQEDNSGMVTRTGYDALGRPITVTTDYANGGPAVVTLYDKLGSATRQVDAEGVVTAYEYGGLNRWTAVIQNYKPGFATTADQNVRTEFTYDARGNRLTQTDPQGNVTQFAYDALDRQVSVTDPLTHTTVYTYNTVGLWVGQLDANGASTTFAYDGLRRRTGIDYPAGTTDVVMTYNAAGSRTVMTDAVGTTLWTYDALGRPLTVTAPLTGSVSYRYDLLGNRTHLIYPDGKVVTTTHTALNQVSGLTDWASQTSSFQYDAAGRPLTTTLPNGIMSVYRYDTAQRIIGLSHSNITGTIASYTYTLDARGNWQVAQEALLAPGAGSITQTAVLSYSYDALYRATDVLYSDGTAFQYAYDAAGNVLTRTQTVLSVTVVTTYTYNAANQLVTAKSDNSAVVWHYAYDDNGSLTAVTPDGSPGSGALRYTYNAALQLVQVERHDGSDYELLSEMLYDGLGQRRQMTAWEGGLSATTTYAVDGERGGAVLAATAAGQTTFYVHGPSGPLAELTASWGFYLADGQGTARQLADAAGAVTLVRRYTPWGEILDQAGTGTFAWGYFGGLMDAATGLIYVGGGQYFDPATGRFLTRAVAPGAPNPYVPWRADPLGAALGPVGLLVLLRRRRGQTSKADRLFLLLLLLVGGALVLAACDNTPPPPPPTGEGNDTQTSAPTQAPPTESQVPQNPTASPTKATGRFTQNSPGAATSTPTCTPTLIPSPTSTATATATATSTATPTATPILPLDGNAVFLDHGIFPDAKPWTATEKADAFRVLADAANELAGPTGFGSLSRLYSELGLSTTAPIPIVRRPLGSSPDNPLSAFDGGLIFYDAAFPVSGNSLTTALAGHELAHLWDKTNNLAISNGMIAFVNWGVPATGYGASKPRGPLDYQEDLAEAVRVYFWPQWDENRLWTDDMGAGLASAGGTVDGLQTTVVQTTGVYQSVQVKDRYDWLQLEFTGRWK